MPTTPEQAAINALATQRDSALNQVVQLHAHIAVLTEQLEELQEKLDSLKEAKESECLEPESSP